jgi:hypothetical protein
MFMPSSDQGTSPPSRRVTTDQASRLTRTQGTGRPLPPVGPTGAQASVALTGMVLVVAPRPSTVGLFRQDAG